MHDIEDLTRILGWKDHELRARLRQLDSILGSHIRHGPRNKILVTDDGLVILQRAKELESEGHSLKEVYKLLEEELSNVDSKGHITLTQLEQRLLEEKDKRIEELKAQIMDLRKQLEIKDLQISQLQDLLHRQLPPPGLPWWRRLFRG